MFDTMIVNNPQVDLITPLEGTFPIIKGPTRLVKRITPEAGGCGNTMICGNRIGLSCLPFGGIGDDIFGDYILKVYGNEDIFCDAIHIYPGSETSKVVILVDTNGDHVFASMIGGHLGDMDKLDHWINMVKSVYFTGYLISSDTMRSDCIAIVERAYELGKTIFFDPGPLIPMIPQRDMERLLTISSVNCMNDEEAMLISGCNTSETAAKKLFSEFGGIIIVKDGPNGCFFVSPEIPTGKRIPGFDVPLVDTTAAGDSFLGAFMYAHLHGWDICDALTLANATGAAAVAKLGSGTEVPYKEEIKAVLKTKNISFDF